MGAKRSLCGVWERENLSEKRVKHRHLIKQYKMFVVWWRCHRGMRRLNRQSLRKRAMNDFCSYPTWQGQDPLYESAQTREGSTQGKISISEQCLISDLQAKKEAERESMMMKVKEEIGSPGLEIPHEYVDLESRELERVPICWEVETEHTWIHLALENLSNSFWTRVNNYMETQLMNIRNIIEYRNLWFRGLECCDIPSTSKGNPFSFLSPMEMILSRFLSNEPSVRQQIHQFDVNYCFRTISIRI